MQESTKPKAKKTLLRFYDGLLPIIDIVTKSKRITRTKFINAIVNERIQSHKEEIQNELRACEKLLSSMQE